MKYKILGKKFLILCSNVWKILHLRCAVFCNILTHSFCFHSDCAEKEAAPEGRDDEVARRLWEESARLVGLKDTC